MHFPGNLFKFKPINYTKYFHRIYLFKDFIYLRK